MAYPRESKRSYRTYDECINQEICIPIGEEYIKHFDVDEIAQRIVEWEDGFYFVNPKYDDAEEFWKVVKFCEK